MRTRCLALGLTLALAAGSLAGYRTPVSEARTQEAVSSARLDGAVKVPTTLLEAMEYYKDHMKPEWYDTSSDDKMKEGLGRMLLADIEALLKIHINTSEFQYKFLELQEEYAILDKLGVVAYTSTILEKNTNSYINMYSKLITLYSYAERALRKIYEAGKMPRSSETIASFLNLMVDDDGSVNKTVKTYVDQFDTMAGYDMLQECLLGGDVRNRDLFRYYLLSDFPRNQDFLIAFGFTINEDSPEVLPAMGLTSTDPTYKGLYDEMMNVYKLEKSYTNLKYTKDSTEPIRPKIPEFEATSDDGLKDGLYTVYLKFSKPVSEGGLGDKGAADAFIRSQYNGPDILELLQQYVDLKGFLASLDSLPATPKTSEEISKAIATYNMYLALSASEKAKLDSTDLAKLKSVTPAKDSIENVIRLINAIKYPTTETEYRNVFLPALQSAETAYNSLLALYPNTGIEYFIDNRTLLTVDYKTYKLYQDRLFDALAIKDAEVCNKLATVITPLRAELQSLNKTNPNVFNHLIGYAQFETMYNDAVTAKKLRDRVDVLMISPTSDDSAELTSIKTAVSSLNPKARAYFGTLYEQYIQAIEYGTYTDDVNAANRVDTLIGRIGTVNANSGAKIEAARSGYNSLTELQKSLVKSYNTLVAAETTFKQLSQDISYATVTNIKKGYVFTRSEIRPEPVVKINGVTLTKGAQYNVTYSDNFNVGTGTVLITAVPGGGFTGTYTKTFLIVADSVENCSVSGLKKKYNYTGKPIKPVISVKVNGYVLDEGTDYKLTYSNNKNPGTASIKIRGVGNYNKSRTVTFKIKKKKSKKKKKK